MGNIKRNIESNIKSNIKIKILAAVLVSGLLLPGLWADDTVRIRFRLYEGFKDSAAPAQAVNTSHQLKSREAEDELSEEALEKEKNTLLEVYGLEWINLINRDKLFIKPGRSGGEFQEIVLKDRVIRIQVAPVKKNRDVFDMNVNETDMGKHASLKTQLLLPPGKSGSVGFEGALGKVYFLALTRLQDLSDEENGQSRMKVYIYQRPHLRRLVYPEYPAKALDKLVQGTVVLDTEINPDGTVSDVKVIESVHSSLDNAAAGAVMQWKYEPFELKGGLKTLTFTTNVRFEIIKNPLSVKSKRPKLLYSVVPKYPHIALKAGIRGTVDMEVTIDETGKVIDVKAIRGHTLLRKAAVDAVRQWRYEPNIIDGVPRVTVFTTKIKFNNLGR